MTASFLLQKVVLLAVVELVAKESKTEVTHREALWMASMEGGMCGLSEGRGRTWIVAMV